MATHFGRIFFYPNQDVESFDRIWVRPKLYASGSNSQKQQAHTVHRSEMIEKARQTLRNIQTKTEQAKVVQETHRICFILKNFHIKLLGQDKKKGYTAKGPPN